MGETQERGACLRHECLPVALIVGWARGERKRMGSGFEIPAHGRDCLW